jgi:hypothetical protein
LIYCTTKLQNSNHVYKFFFENRKVDGVFNNALLSIDDTVCLVAISYAQEFYSYMFKNMELRYNVGPNIITGNIFWCWWHGPLPPGEFNDDMIFQDYLPGPLEHGKRVEADLGNKPSAPTHVNCPTIEVPSI